MARKVAARCLTKVHRTKKLSKDGPRLLAAIMADFHIGAYRIEKGAYADARPPFQSAADHCPHGFIEFFAAKFELKRLGGRAGAQSKQ